MTSDIPENYSAQLWKQVLEHRENGFCVFPLEFKGKKPIRSWSEFQKRKPSLDELEEWFKDKEVNVAVLCGEISDNLFVLDFDNLEVYKKWLKSKLFRKTKMVRTGRGMHAYMRAKKPVSIIPIVNEVTVKAEGGYVVSSPSIHANGGQYKGFGNEEICMIEDVDQYLNDFVQLFKDQKVENVETEWEKVVGKKNGIKLKRNRIPYCIKKILTRGVKEGSRNSMAIHLAIYLHNKYDPLVPEEITEELLKWNEKNDPQLSEKELETVVDSLERNNYGFTCKLLNSSFCNRSCSYYSEDESEKKTEEKVEVENKKEVPEDIKESAECLIKNKAIFYKIDKELNKKIKHDKTLRRLLLLVGLSAYSHDPINVFLKGESSLGKTHNVVKVTEMFPEEDVWNLGGLSPKALIHGYGEDMKDKKKAFIDLSGKIIVFLEPPDPETFNILKPLLSHDKHEIEFKFTDTSTKPMRTKTVVLRGFPATFFCTTDMHRVAELSTRSFTVTPEASEEKYKAALELIGEEATYPWRFKKSKELDIIREAIRRIKDQCRKTANVTLPFGKELIRKYPKSSPRTMRDGKRLVSLIRNITLLHTFQRPVIEIEDEEGEIEKHLVAFETDYNIVKDIFNEIYESTKEGVSQQLINFFEDIVVPAVEEGFDTYSGIAKYYKEFYGIYMGESKLRKNFIYPLEEIGWIGLERDPDDMRMILIRIKKNEEDSEKSNFRLENLETFFQKEDLEKFLEEIKSNEEVKEKIRESF